MPRYASLRSPRNLHITKRMRLHGQGEPLNILVVPPSDWVFHPFSSRLHYIFENLALRHNVNVLWFRLNAWNTPARATGAKLLPIAAPFTRDMSLNNVLTAPSVISSIRRIMNKESIDVVVTSNILPGLVASVLAYNAGVPCLFDYHDHLPDSASLYYHHEPFKAMVRCTVSRIVSESLRTCSLVVCSSFSLAKIVAQSYAISPSLIRVIPNGYDPEIFKPVVDRDALMKRLGLQELADYFLVTYAGSIEPRLDFDTVLAVIKDLHNDGHNVKLIILGKGVSGNFERDLRKRCARLSFVHFAGYLNNPVDVSHYIAISHACVAPYKPILTNFGVTLKVLEYLAVARPTFVTPIPDIMEQLEGCVIAYRSRGDLYQKLKLLITDRTAYKTISERGCQRVKDFTWTSTAYRYEKLLQEITACGGV